MPARGQQLDEIRLEMAMIRRQLDGLHEKTRQLHLFLHNLDQAVKRAPVIDLLAADWQTKLTEDEVWTLQVLYDFEYATVARLEGVLGYSDPKHILYQLGPLERFGLAVSKNGEWRLTGLGHRVARYRQSA